MKGQLHFKEGQLFVFRKVQLEAIQASKSDGACVQVRILRCRG
jgi:hypothetical protein